MDETLDVRGQLANAKKNLCSPNLKLKRERELKGWSQATLAEHIGAQAKLVTRWETGAAFPSPYYRQKLCELFEKNAEDLGLLKQTQNAPTEDLGALSARPDDEPHSDLIPQLEQQSQVPKHLSRRIFVLCGIGGAVIALPAGGLWLAHAFAQRKTSVNVPITHPDLTTRYIYRTPDLMFLNDVAWSPRGDCIACAIGNKTVQILDAATGRNGLVYRRHQGFVNSAQWSHDATKIASASSDKTVQVWNPTTGVCDLVYQKHTRAVWYLAWSHNGKYIASGGSDTTVQVWNAVTGKRMSVYTGHKGGVWSIRWSPDDQYIVSGGEDGSIHVWESANAQPRPTFAYTGPHTSTVNEVDWSPDGRWIASASGNGLVTIWDALTGGQVLIYTGHIASVRTARWSPNGKYIASGGVDDVIHIWNALTGKRLLTYSKQTNDILEVSWSPDGDFFASASKDSTMHVCQIHI